MTPADLIDLAHRKNAAYTALLKARAAIRYPAGHMKMTEADRNLDMDARTLKEREAWENLCDEFAVHMTFIKDVNAEKAWMYDDLCK